MEEIGLRRCPYCHDSVGQEAQAAACGQCFAVHHEACWDESGSCAACKHPTPLRAGGGVASTSQRVLFGLFGMLSCFVLMCPALSVWFALSTMDQRGFFVEGHFLWVPGLVFMLPILPLTFFHSALKGPERTVELARSAGMQRVLLAVAIVFGFAALLALPVALAELTSLAALPGALLRVFGQAVVVGGGSLALRYLLKRPSSEGSEPQTPAPQAKQGEAKQAVKQTTHEREKSTD